MKENFLIGATIVAIFIYLNAPGHLSVNAVTHTDIISAAENGAYALLSDASQVITDVLKTLFKSLPL